MKAYAVENLGVICENTHIFPQKPGGKIQAFLPHKMEIFEKISAAFT